MKKYVVLSLLWMIAGCFSTPNSQFYLLESLNTADVVSNKKLTIAVQNVSLPDYLQKPQIVLQKANSPELKISEFNRWGSDLEDMFQNTLIEDLQKALPNASVKELSYGDRSSYVIKINIEKMTGDLKSEAVLKGSYQIMSLYGKLIKQSDINLKTPVGKSYGSYVEAQSKLISDLSIKIAKEF